MVRFRPTQTADEPDSSAAREIPNGGRTSAFELGEADGDGGTDFSGKRIKDGVVSMEHVGGVTSGAAVTNNPFPRLTPEGQTLLRNR